KVEPNMTSNFVIVYKLDPANGAKTNATHYVFEPHDSKFGKSLTVKVYESKTIKKSSDSANSNSNSDESTDTNSSVDTSSDADTDDLLNINNLRTMRVFIILSFLLGGIIVQLVAGNR